ncbi:MAG: CYTH domain-containing protein [Candidatus Izemoplasmataceae bacterium]
MVKENRILDKELRQEVTKEQCHEIMDYLMVHFTDKKDYHYNYYFDTKNNNLTKKDFTLRLRTIVKDNDISYHLTLKIPTIDKDTYLEYNERLDESDMRLLAYNNKLPDGEIKELTSIHGDDVHLVNMIKVTRTIALYQDMKIFFDRISHRGQTHYELGTRIDQSKGVSSKASTDKFIGLLKKFNITYEQAERRSIRYR